MADHFYVLVSNSFPICTCNLKLDGILRITQEFRTVFEMSVITDHSLTVILVEVLEGDLLRLIVNDKKVCSRM